MLTTFPKSKFRSPELPSHYFPRKRLLALLEDGPARRLTCLAAGAGYGKSTLAAGFLKHSRLPFLWLNLDAGDSDGAVFLQLFLQGLAHRFPSFGAELEREGILHQSYWPGRGRLLNTASDILEEELAGRRLLVVLEDYHNVSGTGEAGDILDWLLRLFPSQLHFILLSRSRIRLKALPGLTAAGRAMELGQKDLCFTLEETEQFFTGRAGSGFSREIVEKIWRELAGWPIGLQLAAQTQAGGDGPEELACLYGRGKGPLYMLADILAEIVAGEPPEIREVLYKTAVFQEWDGPLFNEIFNRHDGAAVIDYLTGRGLPLEQLAGGLRYHKILKDYLLERLKEDAQGYLDMQRKAADFFLAQKRKEEAFPCLVAAGDFRRAGLVLQQEAAALIRQNRLNTLAAWLEALPGEVAEAFPEILLHFGEACVRAGKYREGRGWLRRSAGAFGRAGDAAGLTSALCAQGVAFAARGEYDKARAVYRQALGEVGAGDARLRGTVLHYLAVWAARAGEVERANRFFDEAAAFYRAAGEAAAEGEVLLDRAFLYCYRRGLFQEALSLAGRATMAADTIGDSPLAARCHMVGGWLLLRLGKHGEALKRFKTARQGGRDNKSPSHNGVLARLGEAEALCLQDNSDGERVEQLYRRAAADLGRLEPSLEASFLLALGQSNFFRRRGETGRALEEAENALELARGMNDVWQEAVGKLNLAAAGILAGGESLAAGLKLLGEAEAVFNAWEDGYHQALAGLWNFFGRFHATGEADYVLFRQCLGHGERFPSLFDREKELGRFILEKVRASETTQAIADEKKASVPQRRKRRPVINPGNTAGGMLETAAADKPPCLRICCLGAFQVYRGDQLLDDRRWPRRKGKTLLKFLVLRLGQRVPKDVLLDLLWPDLPAEKASNAFYVTLHTLRKILSDGLREEIEYVASRDGMIYLEPGLVEEVDVEAFERVSALALNGPGKNPDKTLAHLKEARQLYRGDLLPEDVYADWLVPVRERLRQQYLRVLEVLATTSAKGGRLEEALELWQEVILRDPFHETGQREVIRLLILQGRQAAARRQFLRYRRLLQKEVGAEPGPEVMQLFDQFLSKKGAARG